jgi:hypothetical protein
MEITCKGSALEIYQLFKNKIEEMQKNDRLSIVENLKFDDSTLTTIATGKGFQAKIFCLDNLLKVDLDLSFLLKPLRSQIEEKLRQKLESALTK